MASFYVTLKPLEPYFFGSERKLGDGISSARTTYFIKSEAVPSQSTLLGMVRFFLLKQSGGVRDDYQIDERLIGRNSFTLPADLFQNGSGYVADGAGDIQDFGVIEEVGPLFLADQDGQYYMATPKNHQKGKEIYTPYEMVRMDADGRSGSCLLKDYDGKTGITHSYTRLSDGRVFEMDKLFGETENVGIDKKADEDGFYKKEYKYLKSVEDGKKENEKLLQFAFFLSLAEDSKIFQQKLPHLLQERCAVKDIVYMGLGKSAFSIEIRKKKNDFYDQAAALIKKSHTQGLLTYYTASDTLFLGQPDLPFAVIETKSFRYLMTKGNSRDYWGRMKPSALHQVVKPGSMFWVRREDQAAFEKQSGIANCRKIGMNQFIKE